MTRPVLQAVVLAAIFLFLGVAVAMAGMWAVPTPGSAPSIYDDFKWSSTANGFWHVNAQGATARIENSILTLKGGTVELDRRVQTDPYETVVVAKVRGKAFHRFAIGLGVYHAGTVGLEFDNEGAKCGRGTDFGWQVDVMKPWVAPPVGQWFYLALDMVNPYPTSNPPSNPNVKPKPMILTCSLYDASGHLLASVTPLDPPPNTHYVGLDEAYIRTWDTGNNYQVDWFYAGPPSGNPAQATLHGPGNVSTTITPGPK